MGLSAAVGVTLVATAKSIDEQKRAQRAQKRAAKVQSAMQKNEDTAKRRQMLREERIRRAKILQASEATGTAGSSGELGALSSLGTQTAFNQAFMQGQAIGAQGASAQLQKAADATASAALWQQVSNISTTAAIQTAK